MRNNYLEFILANGCKTQSPEESIKDNLEKNKSKDEVLEILKNKFNNIEKTGKVYGINLYINYNAMVDDNFNEKHYIELINLKKQLTGKNTATGIDHAFYCYNIKFKNCMFRWDSRENTFCIESIGNESHEGYSVSIEDESFWDYIGK